jgi:hypothetical protein
MSYHLSQHALSDPLTEESRSGRRIVTGEFSFVNLGESECTSLRISSEEFTRSWGDSFGLNCDSLGLNCDRFGLPHQNQHHIAE